MTNLLQYVSMFTSCLPAKLGLDNDKSIRAEDEGNREKVHRQTQKPRPCGRKYSIPNQSLCIGFPEAARPSWPVFRR